jgi:hypothetical protein
MYLPTAGGSAMSYSAERSGAGLTASFPGGCQCFAAPCDCAGFDQPPDISTLPIFGTSPGSQPIFHTETNELDWFRFLALAVGVLIGWKLLK